MLPPRRCGRANVTSLLKLFDSSRCLIAQVRESYGRQLVNLRNESRFIFLNTLFSVSEAVLYMQVGWGAPTAIAVLCRWPLTPGVGCLLFSVSEAVLYLQVGWGAQLPLLVVSV